MYQILRTLPPGSLVLDLGCAEGSFPESSTSAALVRIDRDLPQETRNATRFVQADAACLPFADRTFAAVISNHSLEHFDDLNGALCEIRRVIKLQGSLYIAVPDASTVTDILYRWLAAGGGHVNAFTSPEETAALIERATGLPHKATKLLCSSLSFLNRRNSPRPIPRRLLLLGAGYEWTLFLFAWISRWMDRRFDTRTSVYGWAFYFGHNLQEVDIETWRNVCIRCGSGHAVSSLKEHGVIHSTLLGMRIFRCPECGATNPYAD